MTFTTSWNGNIDYNTNKATDITRIQDFINGKFTTQA
jgi:hypothetical protein